MNINKMAIILVALFLPCFLAAQIIDTISFVPVKHGNYEQLITKTTSSFATSTGVAVLGSLKVNSTALDITASNVNFGRPVQVGKIVTVGANSTLRTTGTLTVAGNVSAAGIVTATEAKNVSNIKAKNIEFPTRMLRVPLRSDSSSAAKHIEIDGVLVTEPTCTIDATKGQNGAAWIKTDGWDIDGKYAEFSVLGCSDNSKSKICQANAQDEKDCTTDATGKNTGNTWDATSCCCKGVSLVYFQPGSAARMCANQQMCSGESLINQYMACNGSYSTSSPECICAKGTLSDCIIAIYGWNAPEHVCLTDVAKAKKWPCTCPQYLALIKDNAYKNYACWLNKPKASCELTCKFPEHKEYKDSKYQCCCLDYGYKYGYTGEICDYDSPICKEPLLRCCCNAVSSSKTFGSILDRAENYDTCGKLYSARDGYYPPYGEHDGGCYCKEGYYNMPDSLGGHNNVFMRPSLCACDGSYVE